MKTRFSQSMWPHSHIQTAANKNFEIIQIKHKINPIYFSNSCNSYERDIYIDIVKYNKILVETKRFNIYFFQFNGKEFMIYIYLLKKYITFNICHWPYGLLILDSLYKIFVSLRSCFWILTYKGAPNFLHKIFVLLSRYVRILAHTGERHMRCIT